MNDRSDDLHDKGGVGVDVQVTNVASLILSFPLAMVVCVQRVPRFPAGVQEGTANRPE